MINSNRRQGLSSPFGRLVLNHLRTGFTRALFFVLIWWILTDGAVDSWLIGVPIVLITTLVSLVLLPPIALSLRGIINFIPFFVWHSLRGGVDVARRAMHPQLPISPTSINYKFRLQSGLAKVFMANTVSLLPGTLSVVLDKECLRVHVLDKSSAFAEELKVLEVQVAGVFGLKLLVNKKGEM